MSFAEDRAKKPMADPCGTAKATATSKYRGPSPFDYAQGQDDDKTCNGNSRSPSGMTTKKTTADDQKGGYGHDG
jgi:hypothetical protein